LQHAQGVKTQPRDVLTTIPELQVVEIPEAAICCGSAGIYNMIEPDAGQELGERKAQNLLRTQADAFATSNPGCLLQITNGLQRAGHSMPAMHIVELIDASIRGVTPAVMQKAGERHTSANTR
jgi:glycolate oxidase iron-sulfur subunit